ncbi:AHH domain-containing protein [Vibrio sp. Of7-15]|uniref:AHH domain-containing protein n=1 Tax=Vibrio sp. Of7-15 TaxID=2724879 RepID=UPI001EF34BD8|nr:AHH domain-containing protein [Vibrio sp. Of7-15]MCG7497510.1 AHH domain-containing protein [Vibrio sp. Of7-15]
MGISSASLKKKRGTPEKGDNQRNSDAWDSIYKHNTTYHNTTNGARNKTNHPWYYGSGALAAHHIIPVECMEKSIRWGKIAKVTGYNINHWRNLSVLPMQPKLACQLGVQIHSGPHNAGRLGNLNYVFGVRNELMQISEGISNDDLCDDDLSEIVIKIDNKSKEILSKIDSFRCSISSKGTDYDKGKPGCRNVVKNESEKDKMPVISCKHRKLDIVGNGHNLTHLHDKNRKIFKKGKLKVGH